MNAALPSLIFTDPPAKRADDYTHLSDSELWRLLAKAHDKQDASEDDEDAYFEACAEVKIIAGVLESRGVLVFRPTRGM